ncbi:MAG: lipopolysaccharide core heptose(I) kinase RfaP [Methylobacillus sp.]|jgi:heptose I phosphotransferase|nr:lipopolysaccharide core heptose(I) kinase RfaP [Methylobacillus sp.]
MSCETLVIPDDFAQALGGGDVFDRIMHLQGEIFRDVPTRKTLRFQLNGKFYFAKLHSGVGWREIFKNLLTLRLPVTSAATEWNAIKRLNALGIPTTPLIAYGSRGCSPASRQSFVITEDLGDIVSLEDFCRDWPSLPPPLSLKRALLRRVAEISATLHDHGLNHRDYYICHLCLDKPRLQIGEIHLYVIDLHRMQSRRKTPTTARMKDMAALYFSALDIGLTRRDCLRFLKWYRRGRARDILRDEAGFWKQVDQRARKLYHKYHDRWPTTPFDRQPEVGHNHSINHDSA